VNRQNHIAKAAIRAHEKERLEIGKELRENVNQMLACVKHYLNYSLSHDEDRVSVIRKSITTLDNCIEEIRELSGSLTPPSLGDLGVKQAIRDLLEAMSSESISVKCRGLGSLKESQICEELKLSVYRILQEQLNNVLIHAGASEVRISFKHTADHLTMEIADNGQGFDTHETRKGIGLINIHNRASVYNGNVDIYSEPGKGTTLRVAFYSIRSKFLHYYKYSMYLNFS
jgi:signal transduction histidine kinase